MTVEINATGTACNFDVIVLNSEGLSAGTVFSTRETDWQNRKNRMFHE